MSHVIECVVYRDLVAIVTKPELLAKQIYQSPSEDCWPLLMTAGECQGLPLCMCVCVFEERNTGNATWLS